VITLSYDEGLTLAEIGQVLGSHTKAVLRFRARMQAAR
jgi:hypothetical protein